MSKTLNLRGVQRFAGGPISVASWARFQLCVLPFLAGDEVTKTKLESNSEKMREPRAGRLDGVDLATK